MRNSKMQELGVRISVLAINFFLQLEQLATNRFVGYSITTTTNHFKDLRYLFLNDQLIFVQLTAISPLHSYRLSFSIISVICLMSVFSNWLSLKKFRLGLQARQACQVQSPFFNVHLVALITNALQQLIAITILNNASFFYTPPSYISW